MTTHKVTGMADKLALIAEEVEKKKKVRQEKKNADNRNLCWTTEQEIKFIRNIGTHFPEVGKSRLDYLKGYVKSLKTRVFWSSLDKEKVKTFALAQLKLEKGLANA